jgi:glycosyltransferase involved in cell wall biosynthesis
VWHRLEWPPVERFVGEADVAHSAHPLLMPTAWAARVVTLYDLDFLDHPERARAEIRRDYPMLAAAHAKRADLVVVISEYTAHAVRDRLGVAAERIVVCRPGAPPAVARNPTAHAGPILFVGTIEPRKNLPMLFAAYERLVTGRPDAPPLILAGRSVEQSSEILQSLSGRRALAGRVRYLGYVSDDERQQLYLEASMLVLPSLEEGFGMTAVEAMQAGVPVVASDRGALPEVVGDAGTLIDPTDEQALAAAMEHLLANPRERLARAEAGRVRARLFTWTGSAARLLDAYRETIARRHAETRNAGVAGC